MPAILTTVATAPVRVSWQREERLTSIGQMLFEGCQYGGICGVRSHQGNDVDEVGLAERARGAHIGVGPDVVVTEQLASQGYDYSVPFVEPIKWPAMPDKIDQLRL